MPDQFTMQTQKDLVLLSDRGGILNIDVLSFGRGDEVVDAPAYVLLPGPSHVGPPGIGILQIRIEMAEGVHDGISVSEAPWAAAPWPGSCRAWRCPV